MWNELAYNLILRSSPQLCRHISVVVKLSQQTNRHYKQTYMCSWAYIESNSPNTGILFYFTTVASHLNAAGLIVKLPRAINNVYVRLQALRREEGTILPPSVNMANKKPNIKWDILNQNTWTQNHGRLEWRLALICLSQRQTV
jgi:hypothetical protein